MPRTFSPAMDAACLAQLPAYVDDVLEYATASAFPVAGVYLNPKFIILTLRGPSP